MLKKLDRKTFSERLVECLDSADMKDYQLAEKIHLSPGTISKYRAGEMSPKITTVIAIAKIFNVRPAWLLGTSDEKWEEETTVYEIPILGHISAGKPIDYDTDVVGYEYMPGGTDVQFALHVKGDSMIGARIYDGDLVFVRRQDMVENGEIAVVQVDGQDHTLKRIYYDGKSIELRAENPMYPPIVFRASDRKEVRILGKAVRVAFAPR